MNVLEPILFQCRYNAPSAAICTPGAGLNVISYSKLEGFINNVSRRGVALGLKRGDIVGIFIEDQIFHATVTLGLMKLGAVTFSSRSLQFPSQLPVKMVISDRPLGTEVRAMRHVLADSTWTMGEGTPLTHELDPGSDTDLCRIILTSGTTGEPKAVGLTHRMLADRIDRHSYLMGNRLPQCSRLYCDLGIGTSLGFQFLIAMLSQGGTIFLAGDSPEGTIQSFNLYKVQAMIASPAGLAGFVNFYEINSAFQSNFDLIMAGGSLLPPALASRVRARMCPNLVSAYGSTETSMVATAPAHAIGDIPGAVGYITPGITVEIVDSAGNILPPKQEGTVRIRGDFSVRGYFGDVTASATAFRDGWFYPGDTGYLTEDRLLVISGRENTVLNLGGDKVKPELIESVLASHEAVEQAAAFSMTNEFGINQIWAAVVASSRFDEKSLQAHCERKLPKPLIPARFIVVDKLPVNEMGKIVRSDLARMFAAS
jgi:acyl-coenzyme A synthetase/AMP-(fatty) acid ligase